MFSEKFKAWVVFVYLTVAVTYAILVVGNDLDGWHVPAMTVLLVMPIVIFLVQNTPYDSLPKQTGGSYIRVHYINAETIADIWLPEGYQFKPAPGVDRETYSTLAYLEKRDVGTGEWRKLAKLYHGSSIVVTEHDVYPSWNNIIVGYA